jgi:RNA recognition motif-containing protein
MLNNLIVNYLPSDMTEMELSRMFMAFGTLESVKLMQDPNNNTSLGYGFVKFVHPEDADKALSSMNGLRVGPKSIKVLNI